MTSYFDQEHKRQLLTLQKELRKKETYEDPQHGLRAVKDSLQWAWSDFSGRPLSRRDEHFEQQQRSVLSSRRSVVERVVSQMRAGVDMSDLYADMLMACDTKDLVQKRLVYEYLCQCAEEQADLSLLCINTLRKDCQAPYRPDVRSLALQYICSFRLPDHVVYMLPEVERAFQDADAQVRRMCAQCCTLVYALDADAVREHRLIHRLYALLHDVDPSVVAACVDALNRVEEGGMILTKAIVTYLYSRLVEFSASDLSIVLRTLRGYSSEATEERIIEMVTTEARKQALTWKNQLDGFLSWADPRVVLDTIALFLGHAMAIPTLQDTILLRIRNPLLGALSSSTGAPEGLQSEALDVILDLCQQGQEKYFESEVDRFLPKQMNTLVEKQCRVLLALSNELNASDIVQGLSAVCVREETRLEGQRNCLQTMHFVLRKNPSLEVLLRPCFVDLLRRIPTTVILVLTDYLSDFPNAKPECLSELDIVGLYAMIRKAEQEELSDHARSTAFWYLLGTHGHDMTVDVQRQLVALLEYHRDVSQQEEDVSLTERCVFRWACQQWKLPTRVADLDLERDPLLRQQLIYSRSYNPETCT